MSIIELLINPIFWVLEQMLSLIPRLSLPDSAVSAFNSGFNLIKGVGYFIPVDTMAQILLVLIAFYAVKFAVHIFNFVIRKIPAVK